MGRSRSPAGIAALAVLPVALLALLALTLAPRPASATPDAVERARQVLADDAYQRQHPGTPDDLDANPQTPTARSGARQRPAPRDAADADAGAARATDATPLGTALLVLVGAGIVALLVVGFWRRAPPPLVLAGSAVEALPARPARPAAPGDAAAADALAHAGRHGEAVHLLLQAALVALGARAGGLEDAATSREVLASAAVQGAARDALRHLVAAVEAWLFGGATVDGDEYARCRVAFLHLSGDAGDQQATG